MISKSFALFMEFIILKIILSSILELKKKSQIRNKLFICFNIIFKQVNCFTKADLKVDI